MVRQYKIHTALGAQNDEVIDVTNGKVRFYQPSNLGFTQSNSIAFVDNIGVIGNTNISQPDIQFKLETFGDNLAENYTLMRDFIQTLQANKYITLEYQTEISQVYADLAISEVTKTEGYGNHGQFSETITFNVITKWYTYEQLTLKTFENSDVIQGVSKIYGGYLNNETPIENYNRLKTSGYLNLPNLNLLSGTKDFSGAWSNGTNWTNDGTYKNLTVKSYQQPWGGIFKEYTIPADGSYTWSSFVKSDLETSNIYRVLVVNGIESPIVKIGNKFDWKRDTLTLSLKQGDKITINYGNGESNGGKLSVAGYKIEQGANATNWMPLATELTRLDLAEFLEYKYIPNVSYKYYGEFNIDRLSRWQVDYEIFSIQAVLTPTIKNVDLINNNSFGIRFFDTDGNNYTSYLFSFTQKPEQITVNTDVNNESYTAVINKNIVNIFSQLDFQRFRTRIFTVGTMELQNLDTAVINIKRKADFV